MPKFRKKPVVVEAVQWFELGDHPKVFWNPETISPTGSMIDGKHLIKTLEGYHIVTPGDWIITGVHGEVYPCKPDIFEKTYEPA